MKDYKQRPLGHRTVRGFIESNPALKNVSEDQKQRVIDRLADSVYMDLRDDVAFRYCFGQDKESLITLLNDILGESITDLEYLPNQVIAPNLEGKKPIMDVYCYTPSGNFICEMQNISSSDFKDRLLYYGCAAIQSNLIKGKMYRYCPVRVVAFTNFEYNHPGHIPEGKMTFTYLMREDSNLQDILSRNFSITLCELPRMKACRLEDARNHIEEWFVLFNNLINFAKKPECLPERLESILKRAELQTTENEMVAQYIEHITTQEQIENYTRPAYERGLERGIAEGREEGFKEKAVIIARGMKSDNIPDDIISRYTELPIEEVRNL